jgi:hypothetical protein
VRERKRKMMFRPCRLHRSPVVVLALLGTSFWGCPCPLLGGHAGFCCAFFFARFPFAAVLCYALLCYDTIFCLRRIFFPTRVGSRGAGEGKLGARLIDWHLFGTARDRSVCVG